MELKRKWLIWRKLKKGLSASGNWEERLWKDISFPLSKKDSSLNERFVCALLVSRCVIPGGKSVFWSSGAKDPGEEAMFSLLQTVQKICTIGPIRGWVLLSLGAPKGLGGGLAVGRTPPQSQSKP